ncbi:MAG: hypothetical protein HY791_17940 [Deltaproteobacteria bacterium]|nr:hypothetical protein [Deltaproteobacteria bacterium]
MAACHCACERHRFVEWPAESFLAVFVVRVPTNELVSGPIDLTSTPRFDVELDDGQTVKIVGVTGREPIFTRDPEGDLSDPSALRLVEDSSECTSSRNQVDGLLRVDLDQVTTLELHEPGNWRDSSAPPGMKLELPLGPESCPNSLGPLEAFGATPLLFRDGEVIGGRPRTRGVDGDYIHLDEVARLDDDRALAASNHFLFLLQRGLPYSDDPRTTVEFGNKIARIVGLDRESALILAAPEAGPGPTYIHKVSVTGGEIEVVDTATTPDFFVSDLVRLPSGEILLAGGTGSAGLIAVGPTIFGPFELSSVPQAIIDVAVSTDPDSPIIAMSFESVFRGKLGELQRRSFGELGTDGAPTRLYAVGSRGPDAFAVGAAVAEQATPRPLVTFETSGAKLSSVPIADAASRCGPYELCGRHYAYRLIAAAPLPRHPSQLVMLMGNCPVMLVYDLERGCSASLIHPSAGEIDELQQFHVTDRWVTAVGKNGTILQAEIE